MNNFKNSLEIITQTHSIGKLGVVLGSGPEGVSAKHRVLAQCKEFKHILKQKSFSNSAVTIEFIRDLELIEDNIESNFSSEATDIIRRVSYFIKTKDQPLYLEVTAYLDDFFRDISINETHTKILQCGFPFLLTKNQSSALSRRSYELGLNYTPLNYDEYQRLAFFLRIKEPFILYLHGNKQLFPNAELLESQSSYLDFLKTHYSTFELLKTIFSNFCILFIGCSINDPAPFNYIREVGNSVLTNNNPLWPKPRFFWILSKEELKAIPELKRADFKWMGIEFIEVSNDFSELTILYDELAKKSPSVYV